MNLPKQLIKGSSVYAYRRGVELKNKNKARKRRVKALSLAAIKQSKPLKLYEISGSANYSISFNWCQEMSYSLGKPVTFDRAYGNQVQGVQYSATFNTVSLPDYKTDLKRFGVYESFSNEYGGTSSFEGFLCARNIGEAKRYINYQNNN